MEPHARREPILQLLTTLHSKFATNLGGLSNDVVTLLEQIDLYSRAIDGAGIELNSNHCGDDKQKRECARLLNEIFADISQAMYLLALGLVVPARMLTRRALELGLAVVYLWDLPHEYWGWTKHDEDLSFSKMIDHLCSPRYLTHLSSFQSTSTTVQSLNASRLQTLYRGLSNTVHGKADGLPPLSPERYSPKSSNIGEHLHLVVEIQKILIAIWCTRFVGLKTYLAKDFPQAARGL